MTDGQRKTSVSLDYFFALESDLHSTSRFVEFDRDNFRTYSVEFCRLLLAAGSEVDVACKELIKTFAPKARPKGIDEYRKLLLAQFPEIQDDVIKSPRYGLSFHPWRDWSRRSPFWWASYNRVKHDRIRCFREANLENVMNAVCGLGVIMQYFGSAAAGNFEAALFVLHLTTITRPTRKGI